MTREVMTCEVLDCPVALLPEEQEVGMCEGCQKREAKQLEKIEKKEMALKARPDAKFKYYLKKRHNMSLETYHTQFELQKGVCASCKEEQPHRRLAVDKIPGEGLVGLVCAKCNVVVSSYRKNPLVQQYLMG